MKKMTLPAVLCVVALITVAGSMVSCEKKELRKPLETSTGKPLNEEASPKLMPASVSVTILSAYCGPIECAPGPFLGFTHYNRIRITKDAYTIANYPATMRYTIYVLGSHISGNLYNIDRVDEFNCSQNAPQYCDPLLANATQHYVYITDPSSLPAPPLSMVFDISTSSHIIPFFTGNGKDGLPCE